MILNRIEAIEGLESQSAAVRLDAARFFESGASPNDRDVVMLALRKEKDKWVRRALRNAIDRAGSVAPPVVAAPDESAPSELVIEDVRSQVTEEVAKSLLHEIKPILGAARADAAREIAQYEGSEVQKDLDRLSGLLAAFDSLSQAASTASQDEFDLAELLESITEGLTGANVKVSLVGPDPLIVRGDSGRVEMIIQNALRNAVDSSAEAAKNALGGEIVLTWDATDRDVWIAVLDRGIGLRPGADKAFEVGVTTKPKADHLGMGLAIARRAAHSLGGQVSLSPREGGGASFELRWPGRVG